jgi:hypothetical protein
MSNQNITASGIMMRFLVALIIVFAVYNPHGWSYYHWMSNAMVGETIGGLALLIFAGVVVLISFTIYIRATLRSLGIFGLILTSAFFATLVWLLIDLGLGSVINLVIIQDILLFIMAAVLGTGMCWSHIRRRLTGQSDVDDVD